MSLIDMFRPELFRALAQPTRIDLLAVLLAEGGSANVGTLAEQVDVDLSVVSRHLRELERAGVLRSERRGKERWMTLELDHLLLHFTELSRELQALKDGQPCCAGAKPPGDSR